MSSAVDDLSPCAVEAKLWRECLKTFDYGPDRKQDACAAQRDGFYTCLKSWTSRTQDRPYDHRQFELSKDCARESEKLHQCMMMNMFDVSQCQREMTWLKKCAAKNDVHVQRSLADDPVLAQLDSDIDNASGVRWLFYKAIGKL